MRHDWPFMLYSNEEMIDELTWKLSLTFGNRL